MPDSNRQIRTAAEIMNDPRYWTGGRMSGKDIYSREAAKSKARSIVNAIFKNKKMKKMTNDWYTFAANVEEEILKKELTDIVYSELTQEDKEG